MPAVKVPNLMNDGREVCAGLQILIRDYGVRETGNFRFNWFPSPNNNSLFMANVYISEYFLTVR